MLTYRSELPKKEDIYNFYEIAKEPGDDSKN